MENQEEVIADLKNKVDTLIEAIKDVDYSGRKEEFMEKWGPRIAEIEADQKAIYGDEWNEGDGLFEFHNAHMNDEGYDEDSTMNSYFDKIKEKFAKLKGQATTEAGVAVVEEAEQQVEALESAAQNAPEEEKADITMQADQVADAVEEEVKEADAEATATAEVTVEEDPEAEITKALESDILIGSI